MPVVPHLSHPPSFVTLVLFAGKLKTWLSSLHNFLQPLVTSPLPPASCYRIHSANFLPLIYPSNLTALCATACYQHTMSSLLTRIRIEQKIVFRGSTALVGPGRLIVEVSRSRLHTTLEITPLDKWSARRIDLYVRTYSTQKRQTPFRWRILVL